MGRMESKQTIVRMVQLLLRPVIRLLLELGFNFRDFNEVAKLVYVDIASREYGIKGRRTNMSRVAIMTGMTRREVARLRKVIDRDPEQIQIRDQTTPIGNVLSAWHQDERYLDESGKPIPLPLQGALSLTALTEQFRGDIPSTAIIKELDRAGAIRIRGQIAEVTMRYYMPFTLEDKAIERFGLVLHDLGSTIATNLLAPSRGDANFEGRAINDRIMPHATEAFRKYVDRKAEEFLEDLDDWLTDHEVAPAPGTTAAENTDTVRLGVGIYSLSNQIH